MSREGVTFSKSVVGLVDSGAEVSCIHSDFVKLVNKRGNRKPIATAGGAILAEVIPDLTIKLRNFTLKVDLVVLPLGVVELIIGMDILSAVGAIISCNPPSLTMADHPAKVMYTAGALLGENREADEEVFVGSILDSPDRIESWAGRDVTPPECAEISALWEASDISEEKFEKSVQKAVQCIDRESDKEAVIAVLREFKDIFR